MHLAFGQPHQNYENKLANFKTYTHVTHNLHGSRKQVLENSGCESQIIIRLGYYLTCYHVPSQMVFTDC